MKTILLILGTDSGPVSKGDFNRALFDTAIEVLSPNHTLLTTKIEDGYQLDAETEKFNAADHVIFQYPVFWFMPPAGLKKYLDSVYQRGVFYHRAVPYGSGGNMTGKTFMLSTTWNAPPEAFASDGVFFDHHSVSDSQLPMRKAQNYIGMTDMEHFSCHNVVVKPDFAADKARYIAHLQAQFPVAPPIA